MREIISELSRLRGRGRFLLFLQRGSVVVAWVLLAVLGLGLIDFLLRLPASFRLLLLLAGLGGLAWSLARYLGPVVAFRPTLTDIALRVERALPTLRGRLASSVEFSQAGLSDSNPLAARSVRDTESRLRGASIADIINLRQTRRDVGLFLVVAAVAAFVVVASPASAKTGLSRILLPLGSAEWPARTGVASLMEDIDVHPRGQALALRAEGVKAPGGDTESMRIIAEYRLRIDGEWGEWNEIVLTHQGDAVYERLVDTEAESIEFAFASADDRTSVQSILLAPPPAVEQATLHLAPPAYAADYIIERTRQLGPGTDERAITETPALVGSKATLRLELNKPIPIPAENNSARSEWIRSALGWHAGQAPAMFVDGESTDTIELTWPLTETTDLSLDLEDEHGLRNVVDIAYRIDAVEDRVPSVTITKPESDQAVLPTAVVSLTAEARDDVAISDIGLEARMASRGGEDPQPPFWSEWESRGSAAETIAREFDLAPLELAEGDVIEVSGVAQDVYELDGDVHAPARSAVRRLRIISERAFGESMFQELKALRQNAIRLEGQQAELQDDVIDDGVQPGIRRAQERLGERIAEQIESLQRVRSRKEMNNFEDGQLDALIDQAADLLTHAGRASNEAAAAIEQREEQLDARERRPGGDDADRPQADGERQPTGENQQAGEEQAERDEAAEPDRGDDQAADPGEEDPGAEPQPADEEPLEIREPDEEDREIVEQQQKVRDELRDLIEALDRNEDTWVMTQQIEDMLEEQSELQAATSALNQSTRGKPLSELEEAELSELDRIRQMQQDLAEKMRNLVDDLRDRANELEQVDPRAAEAQRQAADTAEQRETERKMDDAANEIRDNRLQNARNSQQQARNDLQRMLEELDRRGAQAEELQRRLESLIESIRRLVTIQESELAALDRAKHEDDFVGRDRAMIRLNQNTQAVAGEARAAGREAARIARGLDRAADAQGAAVAALRAEPLAFEDALDAEDRSLALLREALANAEELEQQVEEDIVQQKRQELIAQYAELAERQAALRGETLELQALDELDRRALVDARRQGNIQEEIRQALEAMRDDTAEISDSIVFSHAHDLIDDWAQAVSNRLRDGDVGPEVTDREMAIAESLGQIVTALEEEQQRSEFEQGQGNQGAGGGGGGEGQQPPLFPPITELKLLRGLQEQIYHQTRALDEAGPADDAARRQRLRELGRRQQELMDLGEQMLEKLAPQQPEQPIQPDQPDVPPGGAS